MDIEQYLTKYTTTVTNVKSGVYLFTLANNNAVTVKHFTHFLKNCEGITTRYEYKVTDNNNIHESVNLSFNFLKKFKIA